MDEIKDLKAEKARLEKRVKHLEYLLDGAERKAERRRKHIERIEEACHDLRRRNSMLGDRLMPEGMGWPRFEDGEPVRIGDDFEDLGQVAGIKFGAGGVTIEGTAGNSDLFITSGERVKRPEEVLAGDNEPLEIGQTVWHVDNGIEFTVVSLPKSEEYQAVKLRLDDGAYTGLDPDLLTHQRPVLDADGVPIKVGDHGWWVEQPGVEIVVKHIDPDECDQLTVCDVHCRRNTIGADEFTHTKPEHPDSWERIEEDKGLNPFDYCKKVGHKLWTFDNAEEFKASDIMRRCKTLAESGE